MVDPTAVLILWIIAKGPLPLALNLELTSGDYIRFNLLDFFSLRRKERRKQLIAKEPGVHIADIRRSCSSDLANCQWHFLCLVFLKQTPAD